MRAVLYGTMAQITVDDPEYVRHRTVDGDGRIYVGREYANRDFRVILEEIDDTKE